jgi:septum site-determining protein MinC
VNSAAPSIQKKSIRFRARSFVAFALTPEAPLGEWLRGLDRWTENSPGFFTGRPVVLDLNALKPNPREIGTLVSLLADRGIRVYAIESDAIEVLGADLPPLLKGAKTTLLDEPMGKSVGTTGSASTQTPAKTDDAAEPKSLIIKSPVRSGQSVFHPHGDVTVLGSVGSGSEIIAGGSIHIYGTLRGRAFAGAAGNAEARIFCNKNEAELLAVDGWYRTADDMEPSSRGRPIQAFLDNGTIWIAALD